MRYKLFLGMVLALAGWMLVSCGNTETGAAETDNPTDLTQNTDHSVDTEADTDSSETDADAADSVADNAPFTDNAVLVAYYSATGNTESAAEYIAEQTGGTLFAITPAQPYTAADLDYNDSTSRVSTEHADPESRDVPLVTTTPEHFADYDVVFVGYPIWWGEAAWVVEDFVTENDFTGKTVIPFATSASSGIGTSDTDLAALSGTGNWLEGKRFSSHVTADEIADWLAQLPILRQDTIYAHIGNTVLPIALCDNSSASAFRELLSSGDLTIAMEDYGSFEKVGALGTTLVRNDTEITTEPGDVILYNGSSITIYYDTNTWNFTRLGKVVGADAETLREILGEGDVTVRFSANA